MLCIRLISHSDSASLHVVDLDCVLLQVQCGFGRIGSHFWAFETQNVVPDMVTLGKPIGNGFPMGAVVTNKHVASGFCTGMEYFNTCGGCTAAGAAGERSVGVATCVLPTAFAQAWSTSMPVVDAQPQERQVSDLWGWAADEGSLSCCLDTRCMMRRLAAQLGDRR